MRKILCLTLAASLFAVPAYAKTEAQERVDYVRTMSAQYSWACKSSSMSGNTYDSVHRFTLKSTGAETVDAAIVSSVNIDGRQYDGRLGMSGWLKVYDNKKPKVYLNTETLRKFDPLPKGLSWQDRNSTSIRLDIVPDTVQKGKARYMLDGKLTNSFGLSKFTCFLMIK